MHIAEELSVLNKDLQMEREFASTVVSLVPFDINEEKPGMFPGRFHIKASDGITPQLLHVTIGHHFVYLDMTRGSMRVPSPSNVLARAIVDDFVSAQLRVRDGCGPGLFWVPGWKNLENITTYHKPQLKVAHDLQERWLRALVDLADDDWDRYHRHTAISDFQRTAAGILQLRPEDHEWMTARGTDTSSRCPACGMLHQEGLVVCPGCRCVLDKAKYDQLTFA